MSIEALRKIVSGVATPHVTVAVRAFTDCTLLVDLNIAGGHFPKGTTFKYVTFNPKTSLVELATENETATFKLNLSEPFAPEHFTFEDVASTKYRNDKRSVYENCTLICYISINIGFDTLRFAGGTKFDAISFYSEFVEFVSNGVMIRTLCKQVKVIDEE